MGIGGVGSAYGMGSIYPSYVYNPNTVSANSLDKLSKISDDVLDKKTEYSGSKAEENQNPLKKGQTIDFEGIVAKQMQQGQNRAAKLMPGGLAPEKENADAQVVQMPERQNETAGTEETADAQVVKMPERRNGNAGAEEAADRKDAANAGSENDASSMQQSPSMQMERAIRAYEMFMTA